MHDVMTARQGAEFLQTSVYTVKRRARDGSIPAAKIGREWRFRRADLDEWLARGGTRYEKLVDDGLAAAVDEAAADPTNQARVPWRQVKRRSAT